MWRSMPRREIVWSLAIGMLWCCAGVASVRAEISAPSVHWGALGYPDPERTLMAGMAVNRFTEFNNAGAPYNSTIHETIWFNMATLTWTERVHEWGTNLTIGAGHTADQPTRWLQNNFVHPMFHF